MNCVKLFLNDILTEKENTLYNFVYNCDDFIDFRNGAIEIDSRYNFTMEEALDLYNYIVDKILF